jgi:elongation factor P
MLIRHQNHVFLVADFSERHTGKQKPTVHVLLRDIRDGHPVDRSLAELLPVEEVAHERRRLQYEYAKGDKHVFMDAETFDEHVAEAKQLSADACFLAPGAEYRALFLEGQLVLIEIPEIVALKVTMTAAPGHSVGAASNVTKEATLDTGLEIHVPLFIKTGDMIRVDTRTRTYAGKHQEGSKI